MAEIYLARIPEGDSIRQTVVIKRLLPHMADDPQFNAMFIDEARLSKRLNHANIVKTYEFGWHEDELFIAMEFVDGLDTLAILRECAHRKVRMPTEVAVYIVQQILLALDYAHNQVDDDGKPLGVVHRDISPSNILLSRRGEVKLVDFGIARAAQQSHKTRDGTLKGKYGYMSPEQVVDVAVDVRSDIFSVGIVLAELLTGRRLFAATNELDVLLMVRDAQLDRLDRYGGHLGMDLDRILRKALSKRVEDRFATARELGDVLAEWMEMKGHQVTPLAIAQIIESLYSAAWKRKRESMVDVSEARAALAAGKVAPAGQAAPSRPAPARPSVPAARTAIPRFVDDDLSEPSEIDGIPSGKLQDPDSIPVVSIEPSDGVVAYEMENLETNRMPGYDRPIQRLTGPARPIVRPGSSSDYEETKERDPGPGQRAAADSNAGASQRQYTSIDSAVEALGRAGRASSVDAALDALGDAPVDELVEMVIDGDTDAETNPSAIVDARDDIDTDAITSVRDPTEDDVITNVQSSDMPVVGRRKGGHDRPGNPAERTGRPAVSTTPPATAVDSIHEFDGSAVSARESPDGGRTAARGQASEVARARLQTPVPSYPDDAGDFSESPPIAVFYRLAVSRATGLLVTTAGGICKHIYFRNGIPEYVSSNVATELFGEYLVKCGALMPGELSMALAVMPRHGGKLGDTLVELGLLRPLDVFRHLTRQVRAKMVDVCTWFKGQFEWYGGQEHQRDAFPLDLNPFEVIGAGAMMLPMDRLEEWAATIATRRPHLSPDARTSPELFQLGDFVDGFCAELDGSRTVMALRARLRVPAEVSRYLRTLYLFVQTELVALA